MASRWCHFKHANLAAATGGDDVSKPRAPRAVMPLLELEQARVEYDQHGKGAPQLLLLHSLLTELTVFDGVLSKLAKSRRVTRINLPGFRPSTPAQLDSVGAHADHVARGMGALEQPRDTDVFGNGFGAFVAPELAIRHGARFRRLVVADTLAVFPEAARTPFSAMAQRVSEAGMQAVLDTAIGRMFPPEFARKHPKIIAARKAALAAVDPPCFARAGLPVAAAAL